jgi:hypothetical protein
LVYPSIALFPNSYTILFWEFYFLPFSVHALINVIYVTLLSLLTVVPSIFNQVKDVQQMLKGVVSSFYCAH